jgi:hypothetical protein
LEELKEEEEEEEEEEKEEEEEEEEQLQAKEPSVAVFELAEKVRLLQLQA